MPDLRISLCMIARNEGQNIGRCLDSVDSVVDEIILVDTGSVDDTVEIARSKGAVVIDQPWQEDFSLARNTALEQASGDWILVLDCDEELAKESAKRLRPLVENTSHAALFVRIRNVTGTGNELTFSAIRLCRNQRSFRFQGRIHEQITPSIIKASGLESIGHSDITVIHHGYDAKVTNIRAKVERNLTILKAYDEDERDGFYYYNLGTEYLRLGDRETALKHYFRSLELTSPTQTYGPVLVKRMLTTLMELSRYEEAITRLNYYQSIYQDYSDLVFLEGICHLQCGCYSEALKRLQDYLAMPPSPLWYPTETLDSSADDLLEEVKPLAICNRHPGISVCIITHNDAGQLPACIRSVNEIAREVLVVDWGLEDSTEQTASQFGAKVYRVSDEDTLPGNLDLLHQESDWVLFLEATEVLPVESRQKILNTISNSSEKCHLLKICTFLKGEKPDCYLEGSPRLVKKNCWRHRGPSLADLDVTCGGPVPADIAVNNTRYLQDNKGEQKRRLVHKPGESAPSEPIRQYILGKEHFYAGEYGWAKDCFQKANSAGLPDIRPNLLFLYAMSLLNTGAGDFSLTILEEGVRDFPDYTDLYYLKAVLLFMKGRVDESRDLFSKCLEMGDGPWEKYLVTLGAGSFKPLCSLGTILAATGDLAGAFRMFGRALAFPEARKQTIENLVHLIDRLPVTLVTFLEKNGIAGPGELAVAARTLAKMGKYRESIEHLSLAAKKAGDDCSEMDLSEIAHTAQFIVMRCGSEIASNLREGSRLRKLLEGWLKS